MLFSRLTDPVWLGAITGVILVIFAFVSWNFRHFQNVMTKWLQDEVIKLLKNDDTPIAVYQHETRDRVDGVSAQVSDMHKDVREIRAIVIEHVTDKRLHK